MAFDAVYVQFYNNYCGLTNYNNVNDWNFATWYVECHVLSDVAHRGCSGITGRRPRLRTRMLRFTLVLPHHLLLLEVATSISALYPPSFNKPRHRTHHSAVSCSGMPARLMVRSLLWAQLRAFAHVDHTANGRFDAAAKSALQGGSSAPTTTAATTTTTTSKTTTTTTTSKTTTAPATTTTAPASSGSCAGVNAWVSNVAVRGFPPVLVRVSADVDLVQRRRPSRIRRPPLDRQVVELRRHPRRYALPSDLPGTSDLTLLP